MLYQLFQYVSNMNEELENTNIFSTSLYRVLGHIIIQLFVISNIIRDKSFRLPFPNVNRLNITSFCLRTPAEQSYPNTFLIW